MKAKIAITALSLTVLTSFAQVVPNIDFITFPPPGGEREMIDNVPSALDITNNAEYISGYRRNTVTLRDYLLIKYDLSGNIVWQKTFDYAGLNDRALAITVDGSGNIYITGEATSTSNGTDIITRKYDLNGNLIWSTIPFNGTANGDDKGLGIVVDGSGNVFVCGYTSNTGTGKDYTVIRYNSSGVQTHIYKKNGTANGDDGANAIAFFGNKIYVTGYVKNTGTNNDIFTSRLNTNNLFVNWTIPENGTANLNDQGLDIKIQGNDVLVCGGITNTGTNQDYFFAKYNATAGVSVFTPKTYDAFGGNDFATSLILDASNTYAITGMAQNGSNSDYHTVKYTNSGVFTWVNRHLTNTNFPNVFPKIAVDNIANHFYISGVTYRNSIDAAVYQITPGGNESWSDYYDGGMRDGHVDLSVDNFGRIYLATLAEASLNVFNVALIRYSQTPVAFPLDLTGQPANLHCSFTPNLGQIHDENFNQVNNIKYYNTTLSPALYIEETKNHFAFLKADNDSTTPDSTHRIEMSFFVEPSGFPKLYAFEPQATYFNFYTPNTAPNGITEVKGRQRLMVPNIYPNVDLHYYSNSEGIKYYFVVKPGGDPNSVFLKFTGASSTYTNGSGELNIKASWDGLKFKKPEVYQINTSLTILPLTGASWDALGGDAYKVSTPVYNTALPLIIMVSKVATPASPSSSGPWYTYVGGWGYDEIFDIATDENANVFSVGHTSNAALWPSPMGNAAVLGTYDAFILKCDKDAKANWTSIYGGNLDDDFRSVAFGNFGVSSTGMYVTGYTASKTTKIPIVPSVNPLDGSYWDNTCNGNTDGLIAKFNNITGSLVYSQYLGGCDDDAGYSIAVDTVIGRIYVAGYVDDRPADCASITFPWKSSGNPNEWINTGHNNAGASNYDGYIFAMNVSHVQQYGTFIGGGGVDIASEIIVNMNTGDYYITGHFQYSNVSPQTGSAPFLALNDGNFPLAADAGSFFQSTKPSAATNYNAYIARFNKNYEMLWSTLFEGDNGGLGTGIDVAPNGDVYATGISLSSKSSTVNCGVPNDDGFPICNPFQTAAGGTGFYASDIYLARFNNNNAILYSSLYGGDDYEKGLYPKDFNPPKVVAEKNNSVFVTGVTVHDNASSNSFPTLANPGLRNQATNSSSIVATGSSDAFILWFDSFNQRQWATHFGGPDYNTTQPGDEIGYSIALFGSTQLYIAGSASTYTLPLACPPNVSGPPYCKTNNSNSNDGFIARFDISTLIGVKEHQILAFDNKLEVYPNPSNGVFNIAYKSAEYDNYKLIAYNSIGQIVLEKNLGKTVGNFVGQIDLSNLIDGLYIISLVSSDQVVSKKIIKQ